MAKDVTISLPDEIYRCWKRDKKRKGLIARLVAEYYGFSINTSRVVVNSTATPADRLPHLAAPLIQQFKAKG